ncbi:MAG TPA: hypothetical protein VMH79_02085 [Thermoanaerobaculia bacterium]|nr:hypothetical protein [Thermoanaerobaculia bacterium]
MPDFSTRTRRAAGAALALGFAAAAPARPQSPTPPATPLSPPFVEKVEVRVRSILVFATGSGGKPLAAPLTKADVRVLENGRPAEVLDVEPVRSAGASRAAAAPPAAAPAPAGDVPKGTLQYLYVDTATLNRRSIKLITDAVGGHLEGILSIGPLEIVLADAVPTVFLPASSDPAAIRKALADLAANVGGKQRLLDLRKDALEEIRNAELSTKSAAASNTRAHVRAATEHEVALLRISFDRLEAWAAARPDARPGILYYANDGFDMDPIETYRNALGSHDEGLRNEVLQLSTEYGGEMSKLLARVEGTLAGKGLTTVPLVLGGTTAEFASSAANMGLRGGAALRQVVDSAPIFFYTRPTEPLGLVAGATGGEIVSTSSRFGAVLDRIGAAWIVTFRVGAVPDGRPHPLVVEAARDGVALRTTHYLLTGSPRSASLERAVRVLEGSETPSDVPVLATLAPSATPSGPPRSGMLRIAANFASVRDVLGPEGAALPLRLALAVDLGEGQPFTSAEEVDWRRDSGSDSWRYQVPLNWPPEARRVAVLVEEVSTGLAGAVIVDVPGAR